MRRTSRSTSWRSSINSRSSKPSSRSDPGQSRRATRNHQELGTTSRTSMTNSAVAAVLYLGTALFRHPTVRPQHIPFDALDGIDIMTTRLERCRNTDNWALAPQLTDPSADDRVDETAGPVAGSYIRRRPLDRWRRRTTGAGDGQASTRRRTTTCSICPLGSRTRLKPVSRCSFAGRQVCRMFITHQSDPATVDGIARVDSERKAAQSLEDTRLGRQDLLGGVAALQTFRRRSLRLMIAVCRR